MSPPSFAALAMALHGRPPYEWQARAAAELAADGWWPALRAPTGAGKTTLVDCWLHALATSGPDRLGRRLIWVVDRRSVVDQIHDYVKQVIKKLVESEVPAARAVLDGLRAIGGGVDPPRAVLWRGGLDDEGAIAMRDPLDPAAVAVVVSTVDQLGSRLLFRGYGLGAGSRALHAGLVGIDATVVLDEAHIAEPLRRTIGRVAEIQARAPDPPRPPLRLCPISATHDATNAFELTDGERQEPEVARRVRASKRARLVKRGDSTDLPGLVQELADSGAKVVGVIMNTIAEARAAFEAVKGIAPKHFEDRILLIGPVRPIDRIRPVAATPDRETRADRGRPFVVVATQTIEVGVDLDLDALVTACAPLDALVQRFGRLDRRGELGVSEAVVLAPPRKGCPVYGDAAASSWAWLNDAAEDSVIDLGVEALRATTGRVGAPAAQPPVRPIRLLDAHVDALTITDARDNEGPAIELLLHGDRRLSADVAVAWRRLADVPGVGGPITGAVVERELELRPLHSDESLTISLAAMRRWLSGETSVWLSDLESVTDAVPERADGSSPLALAWRIGSDGRATRIEKPSDIRPTDRIVVDSSEGGLDEFGWSPGGRGTVSDLGALAPRGPRLLLSTEDPDVQTIAGALASGDLRARHAARELADAIGREIGALAVRDTARVRMAEDALRKGRASLLDDGRVLVVGEGTRTEHGAGKGSAVTLDVHQARVAARAGATISALGIGGAVADSIGRAARHHDEGKRDPRFQAWLRGGSAAGTEALAKSAYPYDPARVRRLREASGWPARKRHELVSAVAVARACAEDRLAAWLVATHHGRNRPFCASVQDDGDVEVETSIDGTATVVSCSAVPDVTAQLGAMIDFSRAHGPWGLAFLEAVVVHADRVVSAEDG